MFLKKYRYEIYGVLFTALAGTLFHFVYEWSGRLTVAGLFAPVNESVWEHIKLIFFPGLFYSVWEYFHVSRKPAAFLPARTAGLTAGMASIPLLFYAYTGLLGDNFLPLDIAVFLIGVLVTFLVSGFLVRKPVLQSKSSVLPLLCAALLVLFVLLFFLFTFRPPQLPAFQDPVTGRCGI